jgi:hypothetical protein
MKVLFFVGALVACGDDTTTTPPSTSLEDPASSVECTGALQYPNPPALSSVRGRSDTGGAVAIADMNGDGRQDIVTATREFAYVHLQNADGSYAVAAEYSKVELLVTLQVRDLLGDDGRPEVTFPPLSILKNNGDGTLTKTSYAGSGIFDFGDVDGGGRPDMVVLDQTDIGVWNNTGTSFTTPSSTPSTGISNALALAVADLDGDGKADALVMTETKLFLLLNNGSGAFGAPVALDTCSGCFNLGPRIEVVDVGTDGLADIVFTTGTSGGTIRVSTLKNLGAGAFGPRLDSTFPNIVVAGLGPAWSLGDLDGDGLRDVAIAGDQTGVVELALGDGAGTFAGTEEVSAVARGLALGDLDGDGRADLVTGVDHGAVALFMSSHDGGLVDHRQAFATPSVGVAMLGAPGAPTSMATLDGAIGANAVSLFGHATDGTVSDIEHAYPVPEASQLLAMDANGDGVHDVVAFGNQSGQSFLYGDDQLAPAGSFAHPPAIRHQTVADFDGDSDLDLVVSAESGTDMSTLFLLEARGDGTFEAPVTILAGPVIFSLASLDVDHDGHVDLLVDAAAPFSSDEPATIVLRGDGTRSFTESTRIPWKRNPGEMYYRDFDGDGVRELLRVERDGLAIWDVDAAGAITERSFRPAAVEATASALGDMNGDGRVDLVTYGATNSWTRQGHARLWLNAGGGAFADALTFESSGNVLGAIAIGDVNGDGLLDIATAARSESSVMYGRCVQ